MDKKMTQIKFSIESDIVTAFKARCATAGVSMTSVVRQWMLVRQPAKDVDSKTVTRPKRRVAVKEIVGLLNEILTMEEQYRDAIPEQFAQRHEWSDHACKHLAEAIDSLKEVFCL
jgi:hypothetical protein